MFPPDLLPIRTWRGSYRTCMEDVSGKDALELKLVFPKKEQVYFGGDGCAVHCLGAADCGSLGGDVVAYAAVAAEGEKNIGAHARTF